MNKKKNLIFFLILILLVNCSFDDKTGIWLQKAGRTMFFSGVYQVVKIESSMSGGEFTQVLHCVRMNNQKGKGAKIKFGNSITKYYENKKDDAEKTLSNEQEELLLNEIKKEAILGNINQFNILKK